MHWKVFYGCPLFTSALDMSTSTRQNLARENSVLLAHYHFYIILFIQICPKFVLFKSLFLFSKNQLWLTLSFYSEQTKGEGVFYKLKLK